MSASDVFQRILHFRVPEPPSPKDKAAYILLGILNCFFFGLGMIIIGFMQSDVVNMMIGVLQLLLPIVGWIWAVVWGVMIVVRSIVPSSNI
ncbi:putative transmembrane protein [Toxoplasma gondii TgCatPRC2]|uniref:Putative transmembrane protein n=1 Tax=Toxoplasma gondii TgCatPRC2 TaxID=1130821 RepID=A0A151HFP6_TOXGO|nr:putative transmembrane protein [Toxoplasma gondii TgCatPRC2]